MSDARFSKSAAVLNAAGAERIYGLGKAWAPQPGHPTGWVIRVNGVLVQLGLGAREAQLNLERIMKQELNSGDFTKAAEAAAQ